MIFVTHKGGDILKSNLQALVNPVDCTGQVVGGLNYQFSRYSPDSARTYSTLCRDGSLRMDTLGHFFDDNLNQHIIHFPTRPEGRGCANIEDIAKGLIKLRILCGIIGIREIGIPALGCGYGGLDPAVVMAQVETAFHETDMNVNFFLPVEG